jgi:hypothetical protein
MRSIQKRIMTAQSIRRVNSLLSKHDLNHRAPPHLHKHLPFQPNPIPQLICTQLPSLASLQKHSSKGSTILPPRRFARRKYKNNARAIDLYTRGSHTRCKRQGIYAITKTIRSCSLTLGIAFVETSGMGEHTRTGRYHTRVSISIRIPHRLHSPSRIPKAFPKTTINHAQEKFTISPVSARSCEKGFNRFIRGYLTN